jgi:hypothetical protein
VADNLAVAHRDASTDELSIALQRVALDPGLLGQVARHLDQLATVRDQGGSAGERLKTVLTAYAVITHQRPHGTELAAAVHRGEHLAAAQQQLLGFLEDLIADAASAGEMRDDVPASELARYCVHALQAASSLPSEAAVHRLVTVTCAGLLRRSGPAR